MLIRQPCNEKETIFKNELNLEGLQNAVRALPKEDREIIEKFWGLTGGPNHSKKLTQSNMKDVAFKEMCSQAIISLRKLLRLDYIVMYDLSTKAQIDRVSKKFYKNALEISDIECIKYLMAFFVFADNGPKMSFEEEPMEIDGDLKDNFFFDEYEVLTQMCKEIINYPDNSINIELLISLFEMMDFKDSLAIKKTVGIEISKDLEHIVAISRNAIIQNVRDFKAEDVEPVKMVSRIRELKERVFPYGPWEVVTKLILGTDQGSIELEALFEELSKIRNDWSLIANFKTGQKTLKTSKEIRTLNVYTIGGLEFTDSYEVMFLYLERALLGR